MEPSSMDPKQLFYDSRHKDGCVYCASSNQLTDEHVPPKVLLDAPLPTTMGTVDACFECNNGFSDDELYLACVVECALTGSADPTAVVRPVVRRALTEKPKLRARLERSAIDNLDGSVSWNIEFDRVEAIVVKIARSHLRFEFGEAIRHKPSAVVVLPLLTMASDVRQAFEELTPQEVWPEVGSRDFVRRAKDKVRDNEWRIMQAGRYRFWVCTSPLEVRMVLSEYLAVSVTWS